MCGSGVYQVKGRKINIKKISKTIKGKNFGYCISSDKITVFGDGRESRLWKKTALLLDLQA
jgi:hypothetical protein